MVKLEMLAAVTSDGIDRNCLCKKLTLKFDGTRLFDVINNYIISKYIINNYMF